MVPMSGKHEPARRRHGKRFVFHYTPTHGSWLNQIELRFGIMTRRVLRYGSFSDPDELVDAVEVFIDTWVSPAWKVDAELVFVAEPVGGANPPAWASGALFPDGGLTAERPEVTTEVVIPAHTRWVEVAAITTGHCTDGTDADEFITKDNVLLVDGVEVYRWRPWRDDCVDFRTVNPYCAKWADGSWSSD